MGILGGIFRRFIAMLSAACFGVALFLTWGWVDQGAPPWRGPTAPPNPHLAEARALHPEYDGLGDAQLTRLLVERDPDRWAPLLGRTPAGVTAEGVDEAARARARAMPPPRPARAWALGLLAGVVAGAIPWIVLGVGRRLVRWLGT